MEGTVNRRNLETAVRYTHELGLTARTISVDELFADTGDEELREKKSL